MSEVGLPLPIFASPPCAGDGAGRPAKTGGDPDPIESTVDLATAARTTWDAIVIGAGPGGSLAARQLALAGLRTLLVDKCAFPRVKVCGGCVSGLGIQILRQAGLGPLVDGPSAVRLDRLTLSVGQRRTSLALPLGAAVSRYQFDAALVQEAIAGGSEFLCETTAAIRGLADACRVRTVALRSAAHQLGRTRVRLVIVADGLGHSSLKRNPLFIPRIAPGSRVGLGTTLPACDADVPTGTVLMSVGRTGYVGMVRLADDSVNIAAAIDPDDVRRAGPAEGVKQLLLAAGVAPPSGLEAVDWRGTALLTRHSPRVASRRLLLLGDAAGYVEPFTGEGMTWAMASAVSLAPLAAAWLRGADRAPIRTGRERNRHFADFSDDWAGLYRRDVLHRQRSCRVLATFLRHPSLVRGSMAILSRFPRMAGPLVNYFWNPYEQDHR